MYKLQDSTMQTFYYTLINMLALPTANSILEIACGTAKLLPLALSLKPNHCHYTATDLSPMMIELAKETLQEYLNKMGVKQAAE
jgi:ubiquinone/menaquinone biosynthesis C-methylase UbiE